MLPNEVAEKIKNFEIQGSEISRYAIESFRNFCKGHNLKDIEKAKEILCSAKKSDAVMRNCLNFVMENLKNSKSENLDKILDKCLDEFLDYKNKAEKKIFRIDFIPQDAKILTHCYSKTVIEILKNAKNSGKNFTLINTETRPNRTGRMTSNEISMSGIKNIHITDSAVACFMKEVNFVLIGCDAIDEYGILNKTGTLNIAIIAKFYNKQVYVAAPSVKFYKNKLSEIKELRKKEEIWEENKNLNVEIENIAYDFVAQELISKVISEFGILGFDETIEKFKKVKFCRWV
ncbi:MAG: hypothetical protein CVT88_08010 [Candidatus Altiarchaeales archaeon HGW-Altiarchaeales-1]|nr:MAG: hypothetical protein CVT88_08010 [Candidatus Altiarchaeales archaeon HGW-Altiarchaeales-1]